MIKLSNWLGEDLEHLSGLDFFEKFYNKYVRFYNKKPIRALADFRLILTSLDKRYDEKKDQISFTLKTFKANISSLSFKDNEMEIPEVHPNNLGEILNWETELFDLIDELFETAWINSSLLREPNERHLDDIRDLIHKIYESVKSEPYQSEGMDYIHMAYEAYEDLKRIDLNKSALKFISDRILDKGYPNRFKLLEEMTEAEQEKLHQEIEKKAGRKNKKSVPQKEIKAIVTNLIKDSESKRFIHQNGRWKGNANVNQIYKFIDENHSEFTNNLSLRQMKTRIKKALPNDMK
jgi:hypothetical protein